MKGFYRTCDTMPFMRYAIWNNKGGTGKTFLTFAIGCEYAHKHPDQKVVMLDLCPQANLSEIILGGNEKGPRILSELLEKHKTIGGYFDDRINSPQKVTGTEATYLIDNMTNYNKALPTNVFFVAGDSSLELQAQTISQISVQPLPLNSWTNVHNWLLDLIRGIETKLHNPVFFIDCNPSFSSYTELAILAAERLIVPCSADGSSARAVDNMGRLVYGTGNASEYGTATFSSRVRSHNLALPSIHVVTLNRSTQYDKKASRSFDAMFQEIKRRIASLEKTKLIQFSVAFDSRFLDIPDAHSVAVACSYEGMPLSSLKMGPHKIHDKLVQVNPAPYKHYKECLETLVAML